MSQIEEILAVLETRPLRDVLVTGSLKSSGREKRFRPRQSDVYLDFQGTLLRCSSVDEYTTLEVRLVDEIDLTYEIMEGDERCVAPITAFCLTKSDSKHHVRSLRVLVDRGSRLEEASFACAGLGVDESDYLFLDPRDVYGAGIRLGKEADELAWERWWPEPDAGWDELCWRRGQGDRRLRPHLSR